MIFYTCSSCAIYYSLVYQGFTSKQKLKRSNMIFFHSINSMDRYLLPDFSVVEWTEGCQKKVRRSHWTFRKKTELCQHRCLHDPTSNGALFPDPGRLSGGITSSQRTSGRSHQNRLQGNTPVLRLLRALPWHCFPYSQMEQLIFVRQIIVPKESFSIWKLSP